MTTKHFRALLAPAEVAELANVSQDTQRDWRRRGLMNDIGEDRQGRWRYSICDCFTLWIAQKLSELGFQIADAIDPAQLASIRLLASENAFLFFHNKAKLLSRPSEETKMATRYIVLFLDGEWKFKETDDLREFFKTPRPMFFVIDLWGLAREAPKKLILEAFPGAFDD